MVELLQMRENTAGDQVSDIQEEVVRKEKSPGRSSNCCAVMRFSVDNYKAVCSVILASMLLTLPIVCYVSYSH